MMGFSWCNKGNEWKRVNKTMLSYSPYSHTAETSTDEQILPQLNSRNLERRPLRCELRENF